jgi:hypothetical protein
MTIDHIVGAQRPFYFKTEMEFFSFVSHTSCLVLVRREKRIYYFAQAVSSMLEITAREKFNSVMIAKNSMMWKV